ncbi:MAG TPA: hypothetical protein VM432_03605 [Bdellovibrionales bacterium]|jgi:hypothetical protein|nr:hypothetical protein [Bdellovibrionales bacterium]
MKHSLSFLTIFLVASSALASGPVNYSCVVDKPCAQADGLGYCVQSVKLVGHAKKGVLIVNPRPSNVGSEVQLSRIEIPVRINKTDFRVRFSDSTGDTWGVFKTGPGISTLVLDQDFEFAVKCADLSATLENT